jgi:hypothetical protein
MPSDTQSQQSRPDWRRSSWKNRALTIALAVAVLVTVGVIKCDSWFGPDGTNLLHGLGPRRVQGVTQVQVLTDGTVAAEGDHWKTQLTAVLRSRSSFVDYDLGQPTPIRAVYLQGDNNDEYVLGVSDDGERFRTVWTAPRHPRPGLRPRFTDRLDVSARYVRLSVGAGDGSYSLSEVQLFSARPATFPPRLAVGHGVPAGETVRSGLVLFGLALVFLLFATYSKAPLSWVGLCVLLPILAGHELYRSLEAAWPVGAREVSFVRATTAAVASLALVREVLAPRRYPAHRWVVFSVLSLAAAGAFLAFFNLGNPQFHDHHARKPSYVHNFDMRVYYPVAKYFRQLRYDGLYQASVAAYADDDPNVTLDSLSHVELRDLRTHRMTRVQDVKKEIGAVQARFTPSGWEQFKVDMRYFRETMGRRDYLGSMKDHGANATPVWLAIAHLIFARTQATNATLLAGALIDPVLLLFMFAMVGRIFGIRTMLVSVVLFGANDFYMFGSNWSGATMRHDWMAYLGLGICALKTRRWVLGGALLALSASIRAFPALALAALIGPALWWFWDQCRTRREFPAVAAFAAGQRPLLRVYLGALVGSVVLFLFSSLLFTFDAWLEWLDKVRLLDRDPHVNHISLRALIAGSDHLQLSVLRERMPAFIAGIALSIAAVLAACRAGRLHHAALLGCLLIPVVFNPANYYIHFIFALPMLALELKPREAQEQGRPELGWTDVGIYCSMLAVCVGQYWSALEKDLDLHFQYATVIFFAGAVALMVLVVRRDFLPGLHTLALQPVGKVSAEAEPAGDQADESPAEQDDEGAGEDDEARQEPDQDRLGDDEQDQGADPAAGQSAAADAAERRGDRLPATLSSSARRAGAEGGDDIPVGAAEPEPNAKSKDSGPQSE